MLVRMLRGIALGTSAALGLALVAPAAAHAQAQTSGTRFGVEAALANNSLGFGVGAFVKFHVAELNEHPITGRVAFDYYFPSSSNFGNSTGLHYYEAAADGLYDITAKSNIKPYVGAGISYDHFSFSCNFEGIDCGYSHSGVGLDIVGGINFMANAKLMPFVELKLGLGGGAGGAYNSGNFIIKGGIHF
jgi:hypothetical protein